jgi:hypothetical protein
MALRREFPRGGIRRSKKSLLEIAFASAVLVAGFVAVAEYVVNRPTPSELVIYRESLSEIRLRREQHWGVWVEVTTVRPEPGG